MDPISNPFSPGAGAPPPELVGRDPLLEQARILLGRVKQKRPEKSLLLTGLRGVGKTVLLNEIERTAKAVGYQTILLEGITMTTRTLFVQGEVLEVVRHTVCVELTDFDGSNEEAIAEALAQIRNSSEQRYKESSTIGTIEWVTQESDSHQWAPNEPTIVYQDDPENP